MEIEIQGIPQSLKSQYQARLRTAKADVSQYKKLSKDTHGQLARSDLLSSSRTAGQSTSDEPYGTTSDRTRLLSGAALLEDGTRRLQESQRIALETEDQGADILMNLRQQREQIENSRNTVSLFARMHTAGEFANRIRSSIQQTLQLIVPQVHSRR
jgi:vesicle transport through interaction with t-SNAREs protein 1